jgi:hypothetical protein
MYRDSIIERRLSGVKVVQVAGRTEDILVGVGKLETVGNRQNSERIVPCVPQLPVPAVCRDTFSR